MYITFKCVLYIYIFEALACIYLRSSDEEKFHTCGGVPSQGIIITLHLRACEHVV